MSNTNVRTAFKTMLCIIWTGIVLHLAEQTWPLGSKLTPAQAVWVLATAAITIAIGCWLAFRIVGKDADQQKARSE